MKQFTKETKHALLVTFFCVGYLYPLREELHMVLVQNQDLVALHSSLALCTRYQRSKES